MQFVRFVGGQPAAFCVENSHRGRLWLLCFCSAQAPNGNEQKSGHRIWQTSLISQGNNWAIVTGTNNKTQTAKAIQRYNCVVEPKMQAWPAQYWHTNFNHFQSSSSLHYQPLGWRMYVGLSFGVRNTFPTALICTFSLVLLPCFFPCQYEADEQSCVTAAPHIPSESTIYFPKSE